VETVIACSTLAEPAKRIKMSIESFCKVTFFIHIVIAQGGFLFLTLYKYKSLVNSSLRVAVLFVLWVVLNLVFDGCPLTHIENTITHSIYGVYPMPGYSFEDSWVNMILKVSGGS